MSLSGSTQSRFRTVLLVAVLAAARPGALFADTTQGVLEDLESRYPGISAQLTACLASADLSLDRETAVSTLNAWLVSAAPPALADFTLILNPGQFVVGKDALKADYKGTENCAFTVFLHLLSQGCVIPNDSITAALALANSNIFYLSDRDARKLIADDVETHFDLYRDITIWQGKADLPWGLAAVPLVPKIFWSDRCRYQMGEILETLESSNGYKITAATYREFVDSPVVLRALFRTAKSEGLFSESLMRTTELLEDFVHRNRKYRSSMENLADFKARGMFTEDDMALAREEYSRGEYEVFLFGKKRRWDEFRWLNYQWRLYIEKGFFQGDCGDTTVAQMGFYRALGICPVSLQWLHPDHIVAMTHNFPGYYHPLLGRWYSVQKPLFHDFDGSILATVAIYLYWSKPYWHNMLRTDDARETGQAESPVYHSAFYQGELTDSKRLENLLSMGIPGELFSSLFFSTVTQRPGTLFTEGSAPPVIVDEDRDLLPGDMERRFGTDPAEPDTDGDGVADFYELERGFDPLSPSSLPGRQMPLLDGFADFESLLPRTATVKDVRGDGVKDDYFPDIASVSARVWGDSIYVSVSFADQPDPWNRLLAHSILLTKKNRLREMYYIQRYGTAFTVSHKFSTAGGEWEREEPLKELEFSFGREAEFVIPLDYAAGTDTVYISYRAGGQSLMDGAWASDTDTSAPLRLSLDDSDFSWNIETLMENAAIRIDPKGDAKGLPGLRDIRSLSVKSVGSDIYAALRFYGDMGAYPFGIHSFHLRGKASGTNYWIQWMEVDSVNLWTFTDGKDPVPQTSADLSRFDAFVAGDSIYFRLDAGMWSGERVFYLTCHTGGSTDENKDEISADTVGKIRVSLEEKDPIQDVVTECRFSASLDDGRDDMSAYAEYLDIAFFRVGAKGGYLVAGASFHEDPAALPFGIHTIHARDTEAAENWWIQWVAFGWTTYYYWKDGRELERRDEYANRFDSFLSDSGYEFVIPRGIFFGKTMGGGHLESRNLVLRYITGGVDMSGNQVVEADSTDFLPVTLEY